MQDKNKDFLLPENDFLAAEPPLDEEFFGAMPELELAPAPESIFEDAVITISPEDSVTAISPEDSVVTISPEDSVVTISPDDQEFPWTQSEPSAHEDFQFPAADAAADTLQQPEEAVSYSPEPGFSYGLIPTVEAPDTLEPGEEPVVAPFFFNEAAPEADSVSYADSAFYQEPIQDKAFLAPSEDNGEFQAAFDTPAEVPAEPVPTGRVRPPRKGRPKRKKGYGFLGIPHILATGVWLAIILVIGTTLGRFLWVCAADVLAFGRESSKVSVTITSNDSIEDIAQKLHEAGLVRHPWLFKLYADIAVDEGDIIPGTFEMDTLYDYHALVVQMGPRSSNRAVVEDVLIPEGYNCRQIFALLEEKGICTVEELEEYAANGEFSDFWFLEGVERGDKYCLEGFLFPDTYDFYANSTPREALGKMLLGFEDRFTEELYSQLPALNERLSNMMRKNGCSEEFIAAHQLDLQDLLIVASLIEEETASVTESPTIASVIYNRLTQDLEYERYLGIDAAIIYATGDASNIDTSLDSPYNTYTNAGLTPGPITNPGLDSIRAALNPADTNFYYYVLNPETRLHDFSVTLEEHERKVEKYKEMSAGEE